MFPILFNRFKLPDRLVFCILSRIRWVLRWKSRSLAGKACGARGTPTISDRVAQTAARMYLESKVEPVFHQDSYVYRPGKSALDAVGA